MILIPLENKASRGDQLQNAEYYKKLGVAEIIRESEINSNDFDEKVKAFYKDFKKYNENYKKISKVNGKEKILEIIKNY